MSKMNISNDMWAKISMTNKTKFYLSDISMEVRKEMPTFPAPWIVITLNIFQEMEKV